MGAFTQMSKVVVGIAVLAGVAFMSVPDVLTGVSSDALDSEDWNRSSNLRFRNLREFSRILPAGAPPTPIRGVPPVSLSDV